MFFLSAIVAAAMTFWQLLRFWQTKRGYVLFQLFEGVDCFPTVPVDVKCGPEGDGGGKVMDKTVSGW